MTFSTCFLAKPSATNADNDSSRIVLRSDKNKSSAFAPFPTLSFKSTITLCAVFKPIPFISWNADFLSFGLSSVFGIVLLLIFRLLVDWLFLPHTRLGKAIMEDKNVAVLVLAESVIIAVAVIIGAVI